MVIAARQHKGAKLAKDRDTATGGKPFGLQSAQVNDKSDFRFRNSRCPQYPDSAGFNDARQVRWTSGQQPVGDEKDFGTVVCHQICSQGHHHQGQSRLSRTRRTEDEQPVPSKRNGACMQNQWLDWGFRTGHTGRPTTKRAPSGSDVISAWVGRMFSAQMTPPCASMICLEIARPRPEWLPKSPCGRSE